MMDKGGKKRKKEKSDSVKETTVDKDASTSGIASKLKNAKKKYRHSSIQTRAEDSATDTQDMSTQSEDMSTQTDKRSTQIQDTSTQTDFTKENIIQPQIIIRVPSSLQALCAKPKSAVPTESDSIKPTTEMPREPATTKPKNTNTEDFRNSKERSKRSTRVTRSVSGKWKMLMYTLCAAFCVSLCAYVVAELYFVTFILCFFLMGLFRVVESISTQCTCPGTMPVDLHREIMVRRQRAIVHKTLNYLATHELSIRVEDAERIVKEADLEDTSGQEHASSHELSDKCSECCRFCK